MSLDILETIASLPNDEVFTPPSVANLVLDLLPPEVWENPEYRWLDSMTKSGVFLREIAKRLMYGLQRWERDPVARRLHIYRNMLFGLATAPLTADIARRTLYYTKDATLTDVQDPNLRQYLVQFPTPAGNILFPEAEHVFVSGAGCKHCGAPETLVRNAREDYAYPFIHPHDPGKEFPVKFDVIVGNPPYQIGDGGNGGSAKPIYHYFVQNAIDLEPKYVAMITPSRWFAGGKGLDEFRARMMNDRHLRKLVDNPKVFDLFPGVEIGGGVSYFLWDRDWDKDCDFVTQVNRETVAQALRDLRLGGDVVIRDNVAGTIISKVLGGSKAFLSGKVSKSRPFGLRGFSTAGSLTPSTDAVPVIFQNSVRYVSPTALTNTHLIDRWKVIIPKANGNHTPIGPDGRITSFALGVPIALAPGSGCSETYLVAGAFDTRDEARNYAKYLTTKFVRFLVLQRKPTQNATSKVYGFVPDLDFTREWTDEELYAKYSLTADEIAHIEASIRPREWTDSLDSPVPISHLPGGAKHRVRPLVAA